MRVMARHTTAHEQHIDQGCNCIKEQINKQRCRKQRDNTMQEEMTEKHCIVNATMQQYNKMTQEYNNTTSVNVTAQEAIM